MPGFDIAGARAAGYSDADIAGRLAETAHFDLNAARASGYSDTEIADHLAEHPHKPITGMEQAPYEPTLAERVFGREDTEGKNVEGVLPALGDAIGTTVKNVGQGVMRGGAKTADFLATMGGMLTRAGVSDDTAEAADALQDELRKSALEHWTPRPEDTTPAGNVGGGLGEIVLPLMATGGNPALLASEETLAHGKELVDTGVDATTAGKLAAVRGATTYIGANLPFIGKTLAAKLGSGALGNVALGAADREQARQILEANGYADLAKEEDPLAPGSLALDTLMGILFGGMAHVHEAPLREQQRLGDLAATAQRFTEAGENITPAEPPLALPAPAEARAPAQPLLERPPIEVSPAGEAGTRTAHEAEKAKVLQVTPEGEAATQREHEERAQTVVDRATELGLGDDIVANLERLEQRKVDALAAKSKERLPALPPPDQTMYVDSGGQAATTPQLEDFTRAVNAKAAAAAQADRELGYTPDVAAAGFAREHSQGQDVIPLGDVVSPTDPRIPAETPVSTPLAEVAAPLNRRGEAIGTPPATAARPEAGSVEPAAPAGPAERIKQTGKPDERVDDVLAYVAKRGGISTEEAIAQGLDPATVKSAKGYGLRKPFKKGGMSFDAAAEMLHEAGFPVVDEQGRYSANKVLDVLDRATRGDKVFSERNAQHMADVAEERRLAEERQIESKAITDRRGNIPERKRVAAMSTEEMRAELLTSHVTGLPNKRAYEEAERLPHQASIDVDSLKWINDNMGHESGDELLRAVGQALKDVSNRAYHFSGDEFVLEGSDKAEIDTLMEAVEERLAQAQIEVTLPDGKVVTYDGIGVSYGTGGTLEQADHALSTSKLERERTGSRAARGTRPAGVTEHPAEGRQDHEGDAAAGEAKPPRVGEPSLAERNARGDSTAEHIVATNEGYVSHTASVEHVELATKPEKPGVGERKSKRPPSDKQPDLFTNEDARPRSTDRQIELANKLLNELDRYAAKDGDVKTVAVAINRSFQTDHTASLVGQTIRTPKDLATLAQVFRNPRYETLRYYAIGKDGKVVGQTGVSSRLPASGAAFPTGQDWAWVEAFVKRTGAIKLMMTHNHPSGVSSPSEADISLTIAAARKLKMFVSHVVIDSNEYSHIWAEADGKHMVRQNVELEGMGPDVALKPDKPHPILGRRITDPLELANVAKSLQSKNGYLSVIGVSGRNGGVRSLGETPTRLIMDPERAKSELMRFGLQNGTSHLFIAGAPNDWLRDTKMRQQIARMIDTGLVWDVVTQEGESAHKTLPVGYTKPEYGLYAHSMAAEVTPRDPYADLLGDDTRTAQEVANRERAKDKKRSPNTDVDADTGKPGDLFTKAEQADLIREGELTHKEVAALLEDGDTKPAQDKLDKQIRAVGQRLYDLETLSRQVERTAAYDDLHDQLEGDFDELQERREELFGEQLELGAKDFEQRKPGTDVGEEPARYGERREVMRRDTARKEPGRRSTDIPPEAKKGYAAVAQRAIDAWNEKIGWRYSPLGKLPGKSAYLEERYKALGRVGQSQEIGRDLYKALSVASDADKQAIYEYMTNRAGDSSTIENHDVRKTAVHVKDLIDKIGRRLVDTGLLSQEAYEAHAGEYLPRLYLKHMLGDDAFAALGNGKRLSDLGYLKKRQDIPEEVRRVILGEITDPAFLASFGVSRTLRDLALVDFLGKVAGREQWTPAGATVEWNGRPVSPFWLSEEARQLRKRSKLMKPADGKEARAIADRMDDAVDAALEKLGKPDPKMYEQVPNSNRYGALRGLWVRREIYDDLVGAQQFIPRGASVAETLLGQGGVLTKATQWWKMSKVVLNPPTQVRNFLSNLVLLHLSGVPMHRIYSGELVGRAVKSIASKDRYYQIAKKYGLFATTFANQEGARIREEWIAAQDLEGTGMAKLKAFGARLTNTASDVYGTIEAVGKIAKLIDAMEREGMKESDAMLAAHDALFDYSLVPRSVQYLRNQPLGSPFITFMYKALGSMAENLVKHPLRFAPYVAIPYLLKSLIENAYDVDDDDLKRLRKAFPSWMNERGHMLLLPYKDEQNRWQVVDMGYLAPWGQFADLAAAASEGKGAKEALNLVALSGPLSDVTAAIETNRDPFTGKEITRSTDPPVDQFKQLMGYVWDLVAPGILTSQGGLNQLRKSLTGETNVRGELGATPTQASLRLLGINLYPVDPDASRAANLRGMRFALDEKRQRLRELLKNPNLTKAQSDAITKTWTEILQGEADAIEAYERDSRVSSKLK